MSRTERKSPVVRKGNRNEEVSHKSWKPYLVGEKCVTRVDVGSRVLRLELRVMDGVLMSQVCINGARECDGCMYCHEQKAEKIGVCEHCSDPITEGDSYYDIDGTLIHWDCLREWAAQYLK